MMASYEQWVESLGLPIHKGHSIEDLRTVETGWWEERGCNAAFIQLVGLGEIADTKVMGIPPGKTTQAWKFALDELYYVLEGTGLTTVWKGKQRARKTFEWHKRSFFMIPRQSFRQLTNAQGDKEAKLISYNFLPFAMQTVEDLEFFFNNPYVPSQGDELEGFYSEAKEQWHEGKKKGPYQGGVYEGRRIRWHGNFFPDLAKWDKLEPHRDRGAGGLHVGMIFPNSTSRAHMSVFDVQTYKKGHRHGPGRFIVIPEGEGYSVLWEEGKEKIFCPWHEASCFVPPDRWYHQHFNLGRIPARYLAIAPTRLMSGHLEDRTEDMALNQIEYPDEDPLIRQTFEKELSKRGLTSLMVEEAYKDRNYKWENMGDME